MSNVFEDIDRVFPAVSLEDWKKAVEKALKGEAFEKKLVVRTLEGLHIQPLYTREHVPSSVVGKAALECVPGEWPYTRGFPRSRVSAAMGLGSQESQESSWALCSRVAHASAGAVNALALDDLEGGVQTLEIPLVRAAEALSQGLTPGNAGALWVETDDDLAKALQGVLWHLAPVALCPQWTTNPVESVRWAVDVRNAFFKKQAGGASEASLSAPHSGGGIFVQCDLVSAALWGQPSFESIVETLAGQGMPSNQGASSLEARPFLLSSEGVHNAGGTVVQEMALLLSAFVALLRATDKAGLSRAEVLRATEFRLAVASDFFTEIAKLRAMRTCLGKVFEAVELVPFAHHALLSATTSEFTLSRYDAHVNMLRSTEQTFAAVLGGAQKVLTLPFDVRVAGSTLFGHRMARNIQVILAEETGASHVADAVGGSWYVEHRTEELGEAAWALFRAWEAKGGLCALLEQGELQGQVSAAWEVRKKALHRRKEPVLGVSEFPLAAECPPQSDLPFDSAAFVDQWEKRLGVAGSQAHFVASPSPRLPQHFLAEPFERLRDVATRLQSDMGRKPNVFIAVHGSKALWWNRLVWVKNFFSAGGIETALGDEGRTLTENVELFRKSGAHTVVLVSSDELYDVCVPEFSSAYRAGGAREVWVAGNPCDKETAWRSAGVNEFVHVGCNVHALLQALLQSFGGGRS